MKVGEYVRTPYGIRKVKDIRIKDNYLDDGFYVEDGFIVCGHKAIQEVKSSPNIMDLIEYEDIIKYKMGDEEYILEVWGEKNDYYVHEFGLPMDLSKLNIVSIVTKEQFSQMEYRIGE